VPKASSNKGQKRQDDWLDCLNQLLKTGNLKKHIRLVVEKLVKLPNVPQKKAKFENFLKNVGIKSPAIIAEAWGVISKVLEEMKAKKSALSKSLGDVSAVKEKNVENSENSNEQVIKTEIMENETKSEKETTKEKSKKRKRQKKSTSEEDLETSKNLENIDVKGNEEENKIKKRRKIQRIMWIQILNTWKTKKAMRLTLRRRMMLRKRKQIHRMAEIRNLKFWKMKQNQKCNLAKESLENEKGKEKAYLKKDRKTAKI